MTLDLQRLEAEGVDLFLLREKALTAGELVRLLRALVSAATRIRVLVAGRPDIALAAGAAGVHLPGGAGRLTVEQVHRIFPESFVSVSCHTIEEVSLARQEGASAALFAPVFGKWVDGVEVVPGVGLAVLRQACQAAREMPVFALGGITHENAQSCSEAGAAGVAGIRMFLS